LGKKILPNKNKEAENPKCISSKSKGILKKQVKSHQTRNRIKKNKPVEKALLKSS
jgi:hypothetical protein